nr:MAG TPA: hypothetical protein [Caudoviricetes sp.]
MKIENNFAINKEMNALEQYKFLKNYMHAIVTCLDSSDSIRLTSNILVYRDNCMKSTIIEIFELLTTKTLISFRISDTNGELIVTLNNKKGYYVTQHEFKITNHAFNKDELAIIYKAISYLIEVIKDSETKTVEKLDELMSK